MRRGRRSIPSACRIVQTVCADTGVPAVTNSAAILTYNQSFNPTATTGSQAWLAPTSVLTPRFVKIGVQIDF
jgi:hypothetical protein